MDFQFTRNLSSELQDVEEMFEKSLLPWWQDIQGYLEIIKFDHTWKTLPGIVLSIYRGLGLNRELSISMTNIFKVIYLAVFIHELIKDDEEGQEYNQEMQFSILIGDYMFGRMLALLIEADADMLLPAFSDMICEINEGMVCRYKLDESYEEFIQRTRASFYKTAFLTAAQCAGKNAEEQLLYKESGYKLGMAAEFIREVVSKEEALSYLKQSENLLNHSPGSNLMGAVYEEMRGLLSDRSKLAAV